MISKNKKLKVMCIFSRILGNKTFSSRLVEAIDNIEGISPIYLFYDAEDYIRYRVPKFARISNTIESSWAAKKKFTCEVNEPFDVLFFQSFSLTPFFYKAIKGHPTAVALDTTPVLSHKQLSNDTKSNLSKIKFGLSSLITSAICGRVFRSTDIFLARSSWCADSLKNDYKISPERIFTTYYAIDTSLWTPIKKAKNEKLILLIVGNNLHGVKGGDFLLKLYKEKLSEKCILRVISNDKNLKDYQHTNGVEVISNLTHSNLDELIRLYQTSDVFVFPTRKDKFGNVLAEAAATGLPIIANDTGAIKELVKDSFNGYLMPFNSSLEDWASKINLLIENPAILKTFSENSRKLAVEKLSKDRFQHIIADVIQRLYLLKNNPDKD